MGALRCQSSPRALQDTSVRSVISSYSLSALFPPQATFLVSDSGLPPFFLFICSWWLQRLQEFAKAKHLKINQSLEKQTGCDGRRGEAFGILSRPSLKARPSSRARTEAAFSGHCLTKQIRSHGFHNSVGFPHLSSEC